MATRLAENTSQLKPMLAPSAISMSPFLQERIAVAPDEHAAPDPDAGVGRSPWRRAGSCRRSRRCRRCESCADGAGRRSARTRRFVRRTPRSAGYSALAQREPERAGSDPGRATRPVSYFSSAPRPGRPTTRSRVLRPTRPAGREQVVLRARNPLVTRAHGSTTTASLAAGTTRASGRMPSRSPICRRVADLPPGARDVECAALGEEIHAPPVQRRLDAERRADASHAAPASQTGHTGRCSRGGLVPAASATSRPARSASSPRRPARMYVRLAAAGCSPHSRKPSTRSSM